MKTQLTQTQWSVSMAVVRGKAMIVNICLTNSEHSQIT